MMTIHDVIGTIEGRGERGKIGHVPYGTNTITKKVINVCQYKN